MQMIYYSNNESQEAQWKKMGLRFKYTKQKTNNKYSNQL